MNSYPDNFLSQYKIPGAVNLDTDQCFTSPGHYPHFQSQLNDFKVLLKDLVGSNEPKTFYKFGDGDYHFLKKSSVGSASPGRRALSVPYEHLQNHSEFISGVPHNDYITVELYENNRARFLELYPDTKIDYPAEFGYGLVSNRWLLNEFSGKIGLIGAHEKMYLIHELMKKNEYRQYLGLEGFNDFVSVPQRYACDNLDYVEKIVSEQLSACKDETKIFLLGIGHVKSGLLHKLKKYKNAVFLDVGSGIDALAGIIDIERPYMGGWKNYRLSSFDYSKIDFLQYTPVAESEVWV